MEEQHTIVETDTETGEIIQSQSQPIQSAENEREDPFAAKRFDGIASLKATPEQIAILTAPPSPEEIDHDKARNLYYMSHATLRMRLIKAFGLEWGLRPVRDPVFDADLNQVFSTWDLYIMGKFFSRATGEQQWFPNNKQMTKGDAIEGSKSNALRRCVKDLGIGLQLFDKKFLARLSDGQIQMKQAAPIAKTVAKTVAKPKELEVSAPPVAPENLDQFDLYEVLVEDIAKKTGVGPKGPWESTAIFSGGNYFATFDRKLAALLPALKGKLVNAYCTTKEKTNPNGSKRLLYNLEWVTPVPESEHAKTESDAVKTEKEDHIPF